MEEGIVFYVKKKRCRKNTFIITLFADKTRECTLYKTSKRLTDSDTSKGKVAASYHPKRKVI